ncbi:MAG: hypothetical protein ACI3W5_05740 [Faecousia sp.]
MEPGKNENNANIRTPTPFVVLHFGVSALQKANVMIADLIDTQLLHTVPLFLFHEEWRDKRCQSRHFQVPTYGMGYPLFQVPTYGVGYPLFQVPTYGMGYPLAMEVINGEIQISHICGFLRKNIISHLVRFLYRHSKQYFTVFYYILTQKATENSSNIE